MARQDTVDIVIHGAGIAGLWVFNRLKALGYDVLLLEKTTIGGGQSIASQGIIHSGLKYALAGKVNDLARSISAMPDRWRACLDGQGELDLTAAQSAAQSQFLLIPSGFMGGLVTLVTSRTLDGVETIERQAWPDDLKASGFKGSAVYMNEPVLDVPSVIKALAEPYRDSIRLSDGTGIRAQMHIYTAAKDNHKIAVRGGHDAGLKTQHRPLLMGMLKPAPFPLYAHLVGKSEKPVASITTHKTNAGEPVWYIGGSAAERPKEADPFTVYEETAKIFKKYMPEIDFSAVEWANLPIDRVEGKSDTEGWMPDTPTIHRAEGALYCWPTKLTFAPMLADMVIRELDVQGIKPSGTVSDWSHLSPVEYASAPWDKGAWIKLS